MSSTQNPLTNTAKAISFKILLGESGDPASDQYEVLGLTTSKEVNRISKATITLRDGEASKRDFETSNSSDFVPGQLVEIQMGYVGADNETVFKGIVVKNSIEVRAGMGSSLTVECRDLATKMTLVRKSRYFEEVTDEDALSEVMGDYSPELSFDSEAADTDPEHEKLVQYYAYDWDFLVSRAEAIGKVVVVNDGDVTLKVPKVESTAAIEVEYGATMLDFEGEIDARFQRKTVVTKGWNSTEQEVIDEEVESVEFDEAGNLTSEDLAKSIGTDEVTLFNAANLSDKELKSWATAHLLKSKLCKLKGRVSFQGNGKIIPGDTISIQGLGERFSGLSFISGVRQELQGGNWVTDVQFGLSAIWITESPDVEDIAAQGILPPATGLHIGIVTKLEEDPLGEDRIKVLVPTIDPDGEGIWARMSKAGAGGYRGVNFLPDIGDEVVMGYLNNDPRYPVILGGLHSSTHPSPAIATDDNFVKGQYSGIGSRIEFDDDNRTIMIQTLSSDEGSSEKKLDGVKENGADLEKNNTIIIDDKNGSITIQDKNKNQLVMDSNGILIKSEKDVTIEGDNVLIKGVQSSVVGLQDDSGQLLEVKTGGPTVVKGTMVNIN